MTNDPTNPYSDSGNGSRELRGIMDRIRRRISSLDKKQAVPGLTDDGDQIVDASETRNAVVSAVDTLIDTIEDDLTPERYTAEVILAYGAHNATTGESMSVYFDLPVILFTSATREGAVTAMIMGTYLCRWLVANCGDTIDMEDVHGLTRERPLTLEHIDCFFDSIINIYSNAVSSNDLGSLNDGMPDGVLITPGEALVTMLAFDLSIVSESPSCADILTGYSEDDNTTAPTVLKFVRKYAVRTRGGKFIDDADELTITERNALFYITTAMLHFGTCDWADLEPNDPTLRDSTVKEFCAVNGLDPDSIVFEDRVDSRPASRENDEETGELSREDETGSESHTASDAVDEETDTETARKSEIETLKILFDGGAETAQRGNHPAGSALRAEVGASKKISARTVLDDFNALSREERMRVTRETTKDFRDNAKISATEFLLLTQECMEDIPTAVLRYREKIRTSYAEAGESIPDAVLDQMVLHFHAALVQKMV